MFDFASDFMTIFFFRSCELMELSCSHYILQATASFPFSFQNEHSFEEEIFGGSIFTCFLLFGDVFLHFVLGSINKSTANLFFSFFSFLSFLCASLYEGEHWYRR
jgi:hypothetical protein